MRFNSFKTPRELSYNLLIHIRFYFLPTMLNIILLDRKDRNKITEKIDLILYFLKTYLPLSSLNITKRMNIIVQIIFIFLDGMLQFSWW